MTATAPVSRRPSREAVRARLSVSLLFAIMSVTLGSWASRVPDVRRAVGLGDTTWGLANSATNIGEVLSLAIVAVLIGQVSARRLSLAGAVLILVNAPVLAASSTLVALLAGLLVWGFAANLLATPMNSQAVEVQRQYGRPLLSTFHAIFSIGLLAGGTLGTLAAAAGVTPGVQLAVSSAVLGVLLLGSGRWLPELERPAPAADRPRRRLRDRFTPQLLLLAVIAFLGAFTTGAGTQWSAIYTSQTLRAGAVVGAATYTCLAIAGVVARLSGDRLVARFGRLRLLRMSTLVGAAGLGCALLVGTPAAAVIGFTVLGLGMACVDPTIYSFAGSQPDVSSGEGVSVVVMGQWPGFLAAPPVIGALAGVFGLRAALVAVVVAALCVAPLAGRIKGGGERSVAQPG
jgi:MFS transporter